MRAKFPYTRYRPVRTNAGGGTNEVLADPKTIFGRFVAWEEGDKTMMKDVDVNEDILVGDVFQLEGD